VSRLVSSAPPPYIQRNQPTGVPPLALTGERTLPDVPAENYWFRRHLAVYEWVAARVAGMRVIDMACGEGYGADLLARAATSVIGVDANPDAYEHARLRYRRQNLRFEREPIETFTAGADAVVCLQTIEHLQDPDAVLAHFRSLLRSRKTGTPETVYLSTPNVLKLASQGAERSDNPWHLREYRAEELLSLCRRHFESVTLCGVFHARKLRLHELALRLGWDRIHAGLALTERFYSWFTPAISSADFRVREAPRPGLEGALDFLAICRP
jgi:2-polyprenyl-3-methyl-5-hydroxy-6-metoxy-1,4-benzoquinol methylase